MKSKLNGAVWKVASVNPEIVIVAAMSEDGVIGRQGKLPWHLPEELRHFRELTLHHTVVMGRQTFFSIGRPLPQRRNIVVSQRLSSVDGVDVCPNLSEALALARGFARTIFVIGGASLYSQALPIADAMVLSRIPGEWGGDVYFPPFDRDAWTVQKEEVYPAFTRTWLRRRESVG